MALDRTTWAEISASPLTGCVTPGESLNLSVPQFSPLQNGRDTASAPEHGGKGVGRGQPSPVAAPSSL